MPMNETLFLYSEIWYLATDRSGQMYIYEKEMPHRDEDEGMWVFGLNGGWYQSISPGQLSLLGVDTPPGWADEPMLLVLDTLVKRNNKL